MGKPSKYAGIPRALWAQVRENEKQDAMTTTDVPPNAFAASSPVDTPEIVEPQAPPPKVSPRPAAPQAAIPRNLFDGTIKTLDVMGRNGSTTDPIPGYRLSWFNDHGGTGIRISQATLSGWEFVDNDEVMLSENLVGNNDLGSHVSKIVNPNVTPPTRAYLMKKPNWLNDQHMAERDQIHQRQEAALRAGTLGRKPEDKQYAPHEMAGHTSLPPIEISSTLSRTKGDMNG
jgi:hypothetical protein